MFKHTTTYRVRYADTDQMQYMYYGAYARLYEIGRVESMRSLGCLYSRLEAEGFWMPVFEVHARYLKPAYYDDELQIETTIPVLPSTRIDFHYTIRRAGADEQVIHRASTQLVFLRSETGRPCRGPDMLLEALNPFFL